jgi:hypothetical protein
MIYCLANRNAKRDFPTRDSHLYKCLILKASFVFEFSLTPDGHDYRGMSSGHTDVLSKVTTGSWYIVWQLYIEVSSPPCVTCVTGAWYIVWQLYIEVSGPPCVTCVTGAWYIKNVLQCGTNDHYYWHIISRLEPLQVVLQECKARFSYTRQSFI